MSMVQHYPKDPKRVKAAHKAWRTMRAKGIKPWLNRRMGKLTSDRVLIEPAAYATANELTQAIRQLVREEVKTILSKLA